ncbi:MAG: hypothetical protein RIE73_11670 [Coleofasciculus sp. C1-SOL-03]|jgi:hypothetical protein
MMNRIRKIVFHPLLVLATCLGSLGIDLPAEASFFYNFDSSFPNPDAVTTGGLTSPSGLSPTFTTSTENGILTLSDSQSANNGGSVQGFWGITDQVFTDVKVSAILNPSASTDDQLVLFARGKLNTFDTYAATIDFFDGDLLLSKVVGTQAIVLDEIEGAFSDLNRSYFLEFEVVGNRLTSRVFDSPGGTQLFSLTTTDPQESFTSGVSGVGLQLSPTALINPLNGTFDNVTSVPVPEPTTSAGLLLTFGVASSGWVVRHKLQSQKTKR